MTQHELDTIVLSGEGYKTEFKRNVNTDLSKELVAFANSSGGKIFLGIEDDGTITGVTIDNALKSKVQMMAHDCDPSIPIEPEPFNNVLIVTVPEGKDKPYRCTNGFYIRNGASTIKLSTQEIIDFIKTEGKVKFDELRITEPDYRKETDEQAVNKYISLLQLSSPIAHHELLINLGVVYYDEDPPVFNNTGILFFAQHPTKYIPQSAVTCVAYKGNSKVDIIDKKTFEFNLISNIDESLAFLKRHLNVSFEIKTNQRKEKLEIPEVALREAIVNAVAHRDYFEKGANVMVEVFDNRVEISNPGGLPKGLNSEDFGTRTLARNPLIAALLNRAGYIEKLGTGVPRIRQFMEAAGLPQPHFQFDGFFTIMLRRYNNIAELRKVLRISEAKAVRIAVILEKMIKNEKLLPEKMAEQLQTTARTIRNDIEILQQHNWVNAKGATNAKEYELTVEGKDKTGKYF
jgi:ATP-dependent DNA helicase RecG